MGSEGILLTREQLEEWAGRSLSDREIDRIAEAIPWSSIPEAINVIADTITAEGYRIEDFIEALLEADRAAEGDSNDREIEALQDVRDIAMGLLGVQQTYDGESYEKGD